MVGASMSGRGFGVSGRGCRRGYGGLEFVEKILGSNRTDFVASREAADLAVGTNHPQPPGAVLGLDGAHDQVVGFFSGA
jgi:hypothetical protein